MLKKLVFGMLLMGVGIALVYYSAQLVYIIGRIQRAEKNLGGTRNAIVLFGFTVIVLGVLFAFGVLSLSSPTEIVTADIIN